MLARSLVFDANGTVTCEIDHPDLGWIPFTASGNDPVAFGADLYNRIIQGEFGPVAPYVAPPIDEASRIANLWQAAHDYEYAQVSGSAIGLLAMGVMQGLPKCLAVQNWIKSIWTTYYERKAGTSEDYDFSIAGACPHSVPELMVELGV